MSAQADIRARLDRFVTDLTSLVRLATVTAFEEAFEAQRAAVRPAKRAPAASRMPAASRAPAASRRRGARSSTKRGSQSTPGRDESTGELAAESSASRAKPRRKNSKPAKAQPASEDASSSKQLTLPLE